MSALRALSRPAAPTLPRAVTLAVRIVGAVLLVTMGAIHLKLWVDGYRDINWIGPLFLANAVLGALAALAVLLTPTRWLPVICLLAALLEIGTLGGLVLSLTVGLFGFYETLRAPLVVLTIVVESAGFLLLGSFAAWALLGSRHRSDRAGG